MIRQIAQASPSNPGASRSADFQPPTGNPQTVPGQVFPETPSLQTQGADEILQDGNARISVPTSGSNNTSPQVTEAKSNDWLIFCVVAAVVLVIAGLLWLKRRKSAPVAAEPVAEPVVAVSTPVSAPVVAQQPAKKKPIPKKSKSQRKKRARR